MLTPSQGRLPASSPTAATAPASAADGGSVHGDLCGQLPSCWCSLAGELFPCARLKESQPRPAADRPGGADLCCSESWPNSARTRCWPIQPLLVSQRLRRRVVQHSADVSSWVLWKSCQPGDLTYRFTEDADRVSEVLYKTHPRHSPQRPAASGGAGNHGLAGLEADPGDPAAGAVDRLVDQPVRCEGDAWPPNAVRKRSVNWQVFSVRRLRACRWCGPLRLNPGSRIALSRKLIPAPSGSGSAPTCLVALQHPVVGIIEVIGLFCCAWAWRPGGFRAVTSTIPGLSSYLTGLIVLIDPIAHVTKQLQRVSAGPGLAAALAGDRTGAA